MNFIPYQHIVFKTPFSKDEVLQHLKTIVEEDYRQGVFLKVGAKPYTGKFNGDSFEIRRIAGFKTSFRPQITAIVEPVAEGSVVHVNGRLSTLYMVWISVITVLFLVFSPLFYNAATGHNQHAIITLAQALAVVLVYTMVTLAFNWEFNRVKKDLQKALEGAPVQA